MRLGLVLFLVLGFLLAGCESDPPKFPFSDLDMSVADAGSGEKLFQQSNNGAPNCSSCHKLDDSGGGIGPSLAGVSERAGSRVSGESAEEYIFWSIMRPSKYLVVGFSNVMYAKYEDAFQASDVADIIAYLLTLK